MVIIFLAIAAYGFKKVNSFAGARPLNTGFYSIDICGRFFIWNCFWALSDGVELAVIKLGIKAAAEHQLLVRSAFNYIAVAHDKD